MQIANQVDLLIFRNRCEKIKAPAPYAVQPGFERRVSNSLQMITSDHLQPFLFCEQQNLDKLCCLPNKRRESF